MAQARLRQPSVDLGTQHLLTVTMLVFSQIPVRAALSSFTACKDERMKTEQVPSEKPRSPQPEAAHIARVAHNLILSVLVAEQVSFSLSPPITRVAIIRGLHITASTGIESAPSHNIAGKVLTPSPHFAAACAILCDDPPFGLTSPRHCAAGRHFQSGGSGGRVTRSRRSTFWCR